MSSCIENEDSVFRRLLPCALLVGFSFGGAKIFQLIEGDVNCKWDFDRCLWFVNTVLTTIGYGNVAPCTSSGRVFTVFYLVFSIPLTLIAFNNIGSLVCDGLTKVKELLCHKGNKRKIVKKIVPKPFSMIGALCITIFSILGSAIYFYFITDKTAAHPYSSWYFADALYFVFISITTIGFGDYFPENFELTAAHFAVIILTQSMFSMCINLVIAHINYQFYLLKEAIYDNYKHSLEVGDQMDDKMLMRVVNSTMKGRLLYLFGDKRAKENLQITFDKLARYRNVGCDQQQERSNNKETQFGSKPPVKVERISQTSKTFNIEH